MFAIKNDRDNINFEVKEHWKVSKNQPWEEYCFRVYGKCSFLSFDKDVYMNANKLVEFYKKLSNCYATLHGDCMIPSFSYENDFSVSIKFDGKGGVLVSVQMKDNDQFGNHCKIEFATDQTYIAYTLKEMKHTLMNS